MSPGPANVHSEPPLPKTPVLPQKANGVLMKAEIEETWAQKEEKNDLGRQSVDLWPDLRRGDGYLTNKESSNLQSCLPLTYILGPLT